MTIRDCSAATYSFSRERASPSARPTDERQLRESTFVHRDG